MRAALFLALPVLPAIGAALAFGVQEPEALKILISADMEGVAGVVTDQQLGPSGFEYERFRKFMTAEVNAAILAARAAGATEIVVADAHGNGQNLLLEELPSDVQVIRSWPRPLMMMQGLDESFDGAIFLGYHTGTHDSDGVRAHTMSSANLAEVRLNGVPVSEAGFNAAIAGHFGVPVILVTGDDAVARDAKDLLGDVETAVVKWAYSFHSARTLTPAAACRLIGERTRAAIGRIGDFEPHRIETPVTLDIRFKNYRPAEILAYLPNVERTDSHTVRFVGSDMVEVSKFIEFVLSYRPDLSP